MGNEEIKVTLEYYANLTLVWVGFGTIVGLLAKAIMPGRDPGGAIGTLAMGVAGTFIGCGLFSYFVKGHPVSPISPLGFGLGTAGAFIILSFYRLLGGYIFEEGESPRRRVRSTYRRRRRSTNAYYYDE